MATKSNDKKTKKDWLIANNKKAYHEYTVLETYKAGIALTGTEIKSVRNGKVSIKEAFARIEKGELFLYSAHISPYEQGSYNNHEPERVRKLLMTKAEIRKLIGKLKTSGLTLIPLKLYFERCWVKVELGLCKGKKIHDKRDSMIEKSAKREIQRAMKMNNQ